MLFLIGVLLFFGVGVAEAAAPARSIPYDEAALCVSAGVFFCEDFEGNDIDVQPFGPCTWGNPAMRNRSGSTPASLDCNNSGGGTALGGTLQRITKTLPVGPDTSTNNRVWRVAKGGATFQDIRTGVNTGVGQGTLRGFLRDNQGGGINNVREYYVRYQYYFSSNFDFPETLDVKHVFTQPKDFSSNPGADYQNGTNILERRPCGLPLGSTEGQRWFQLRRSNNFKTYPGINDGCPNALPFGTITPGRNFFWDTDTWHTVEFWVKLESSGGANNGDMKLWIDDILVYDTMTMPGWDGDTCANACDDLGFMFMGAFMNPADQPHNGFVEIDNVVMSTQRIGLPGSSGDTSPPTVPGSFSASAVSSSQIDLSWNASTDNVGVTGYEVERCQGNGCSGFSRIVTVSGTSYSDPGLQANTPYRYRVRALDGAGNTSGFAGPVSETTFGGGGGDTTPPSTPTGLGATPVSSSQISLAWSASTDNVGVTGYDVQRCTGGSCSNFSQITTVTGTSFSNTGLSESTTYRYRVRARDGAGNTSNFAGPVTASTQAGGGGNPGVAWESSTQATGELKDSFWANRSFRVLIEGQSIVASGGTIQLTLQGRSSGDYQVTKVSLVRRDGQTLNGIDNTFTEVTFGGSWEAGVTVPAGGSVTSDPIPFTLQPGQDVFMTFWGPERPVYRTGSPSTAAWVIRNVDRTDNIDWGGFTIDDTRTHLYVAQRLDVVTTGGGTSAWQVANQATGARSNSSWANRSFRILIDGDFITQSGETVQLTLRGRTSGSYTVTKVSLVRRSSDTLNGIDSTFTEVTFGGSWESGVTVNANQTVVSDPIDFSVSPGQDIFMTFWTGTNTMFTRDSPSTASWVITNEDRTSTIDWQDLSIDATRTHVYIADELEVLD